MSKYLILGALLLTTVGCGNDPATVKLKEAGAIYGRDNRKDISDSTPKKYLRWSKSVAGLVSFFNLRKNHDGFKANRTKIRLCKGERFKGQRTLPECSGFLVGPDLLVTAGHCINTEMDCRNSRWIFDYHKGNSQYYNGMIKRENVYFCKRIIKSRKDPVDYALIRLDREVKGRTPLKIRTKGRIADKQGLVVIGHPSGLPMKVTDGGMVKSNYSTSSFKTNLDTFVGNSGSPVFNSETGLVEGILVSGSTDYSRNSSRCKTALVYSERVGNEKVTRITQLSDLIESAH
jgi:V8-like Glu-specific endopeptidase